MPDLLLYRTLVWLDYRLAAVFALGLPLVLLVWSALKREQALTRLMGIYWKVASLLLITVLLLTDNRPLGYLLAVLSQLLVVISVWFWVDLNEELADLPPWRPLPFVVRAWRWGLTVFGVLGAALSAVALSCVGGGLTRPICRVWLEAPDDLHGGVARVFDFVFGGSWTAAIAAFVGYVSLVAYGVGLLQWLVVRLPKQGRVAGGF
ncbi:DUF3177 family protein [Synechococcus sp. LTW-R]|uniref:DUF3177 family protein n=1 Tax=Synechococcus sp. LTW-R TaxID=2751170 RepID=UPI0016239AE5|nr:DUF3177 family protein [Synechococcus sp. LTW-R]QNG28858.1 DUF3177 family protein [Synechococcus sp. LTW-R]